MDKIMKINWKKSNVLVTGADGFIGGHIANELVKKGAHVVTIVRDIKRESNIKLLGMEKKLSIFYGDLASFEDCKKAFDDYKINFCFHIGAQALVEIANRNPLSTFESNIRGTWNILEAARLSKTFDGMIIASSDKAYGQQKKLPYTEESPLNGYYPYDASKVCVEILAKHYFMAYKLPLAVTRNGNTYGPADMNMSRIIPDVVTSLIKNETPIIRSDGTPERDYMYIQDAVDAYILLAENLHRKDVLGHAFNFGTGKPINVIGLYNKIAKAMGKNARPKILGKAKNEIDRQYLSIEKVKKTLNWQPRHDLDAGLKKTIEWYKGHFSK